MYVCMRRLFRPVHDACRERVVTPAGLRLRAVGAYFMCTVGMMRIKVNCSSLPRGQLSAELGWMGEMEGGVICVD